MDIYTLVSNILVTVGRLDETWWRWSPTYVAGMFAICGGVDIMDIDAWGCCRGRQRLQVEEDVTPYS